jgi:hypothetical protein
VFTQPDFVSAIVVENQDQEFDIVVKVYLKVDVIDNKGDETQFIYMAGSKSAGLGLEWSCGASGVDADLLPRGCTS